MRDRDELEGPGVLHREASLRRNAGAADGPQEMANRAMLGAGSRWIGHSSAIRAVRETDVATGRVDNAEMVKIQAGRAKARHERGKQEPRAKPLDGSDTHTLTVRPVPVIVKAGLDRRVTKASTSAFRLT